MGVQAHPGLLGSPVGVCSQRCGIFPWLSSPVRPGMWRSRRRRWTCCFYCTLLLHAGLSNSLLHTQSRTLVGNYNQKEILGTEEQQGNSNSDVLQGWFISLLHMCLPASLPPTLHPSPPVNSSTSHQSHSLNEAQLNFPPKSFFQFPQMWPMVFKYQDTSETSSVAPKLYLC